MNNSELKKVAAKALVFTLISMGFMLHRAATRHVTETYAAEISGGSGNASAPYALELSRQMPPEKENTLIIPVAKGVSSDKVALEDRYSQHELRIYIDGSEAGFYKNNPVVTDLDILTEANCTEQTGDGKTCLSFELDGLYANESTFTDTGAIEVKFFKPSEKYSRIVVVDPEYGVTGKDIMYETALLLKDMAEKDAGNGVKIYFTRGENELVDSDKALELIEETQADLFLQMEIASSGNSVKNGMTAYYNDSFFNRELTNAGFAGIMLKNCITKAGEQALAILPMEEEDLLLKEAKIPAVRLICGYINAAEDVNRLSDKNYEKKVAAGLYDGILEAFEVME